MRIAVCLKQVLYTRLPFDVDPQGVARQKGDVPINRLNEADRSALAEGLHWRDALDGAELVAMTVGPSASAAALHHALAAGADRAILVRDEDGFASDPYLTALALSRTIASLDCDLVLCGARSEDEGSGQIPPILAELLDRAQVTSVIALEIGSVQRRSDSATPPITVELRGDQGVRYLAKATRRLERGRRQVVECPLPAVLALEATAREPRYVSERALNVSRERAVDERPIAALLGEDTMARGRVVRVAPPRPRLKKVAAPKADLSAADRLKFVMGGGVAAREESALLEGTPEELSDRLLEMLSREGLLDE